jgi:hypothetical protein
MVGAGQRELKGLARVLQWPTGGKAAASPAPQLASHGHGTSLPVSHLVPGLRAKARPLVDRDSKLDPARACSPHQARQGPPDTSKSRISEARP